VRAAQRPVEEGNGAEGAKGERLAWNFLKPVMEVSFGQSVRRKSWLAVVRLLNQLSDTMLACCHRNANSDTRARGARNESRAQRVKVAYNAKHATRRTDTDGKRCCGKKRGKS
jgi:hypothetical protein